MIYNVQNKFLSRGPKGGEIISFLVFLQQTLNLKKKQLQFQFELTLALLRPSLSSIFRYGGFEFTTTKNWRLADILLWIKPVHKEFLREFAKFESNYLWYHDSIRPGLDFIFSSLQRIFFMKEFGWNSMIYDM